MVIGKLIVADRYTHNSEPLREICIRARVRYKRQITGVCKSVGGSRTFDRPRVVGYGN
jgi:hypothetical protein